jgi:hypothetical protein
MIYSPNQRNIWLYAKYATKKCSRQIVVRKIRIESPMEWKQYGINITSRIFPLDVMIAMSS